MTGIVVKIIHPWPLFTIFTNQFHSFPMSFTPFSAPSNNNHSKEHVEMEQWAKNFHIPQTQMNKLIMDYLVTGMSRSLQGYYEPRWSLTFIFILQRATRRQPKSSKRRLVLHRQSNWVPWNTGFWSWMQWPGRISRVRFSSLIIFKSCILVAGCRRPLIWLIIYILSYWTTIVSCFSTCSNYI